MAELSDADPKETVILTTGSQGEPLSALSRMSMDEHKKIKIGSGDTVIISATPIPGNEDLVLRTINNLFSQGAKVYYDAIAKVHVSGHGNQEDLKLMANLLRPAYILPAHGEPRHYAQYVEMVRDVGYEPENIVKLSVGQILEITHESARIAGTVERAGSVMVDGAGVGDVSDAVLRDRWHLAQDGVVIVVISLDSTGGKLTADPDVVMVTRGFVVPEYEEELINEAKEEVLARLSEIEPDDVVDTSDIKNAIRSVLNRFFRERTGRRPMVVPVVIEV